jgi:hypothetical protein
VKNWFRNLYLNVLENEMIGTKMINKKKTQVKSPLRQNEKNRLLFCGISETTGQKSLKFLKKSVTYPRPRAGRSAYIDLILNCT